MLEFVQLAIKRAYRHCALTEPQRDSRNYGGRARVLQRSEGCIQYDRLDDFTDAVVVAPAAAKIKVAVELRATSRSTRLL